METSLVKSSLNEKRRNRGKVHHTRLLKGRSSPLLFLLDATQQEKNANTQVNPPFPLRRTTITYNQITLHFILVSVSFDVLSDARIPYFTAKRQLSILIPDTKSTLRDTGTCT